MICVVGKGSQTNITPYGLHFILKKVNNDCLKKFMTFVKYSKIWLRSIFYCHSLLKKYEVYKIFQNLFIAVLFIILDVSE